MITIPNGKHNGLYVALTIPYGTAILPTLNDLPCPRNVASTSAPLGT